MDFNSSDIYYDFDDNITSQRSRLPVQTNWFPFHAGTAAAAVQTHAACLLFTNKKTQYNHLHTACLLQRRLLMSNAKRHYVNQMNPIISVHCSKEETLSVSSVWIINLSTMSTLSIKG